MSETQTGATPGSDPLGAAVAGLAHDISLAGLPDHDRCRFLVEIGTSAFGVVVDGPTLAVSTDVGINSDWDFSFSIDEQAWAGFCAVPPPRGHTTAQALVATFGPQCVRGSRAAWVRYAAVLDRVLDALRGRVAAGAVRRHPDPEQHLGLSPIVGRYLGVRVGSDVRRIYVESAGEGVPVLCLHTAGADSRQFRHLLEDEELTQRYRFVAFDMPWHGRSDPAPNWDTVAYRLDTETYAATVLAVLDALGLERPVLVGCSMGGAIALYLASRHGERFTGVCALEGGLGNPGRFVSWTNTLLANQSWFLTSWVRGLMSPASPRATVDQTTWGYAQSGPGVYQGATYFYGADFPRYGDALGPATCPLYVFSGEYDYSATTEMSRTAAERLGGQLIEMRGWGHFPMSEDPAAFKTFFVPVLEKLEKSAAGTDFRPAAG
jgi:pimeloyl-ACP methyl ester carboxylesterase